MTSIAVTNYSVTLLFEMIHNVGVGQEKVCGIQGSTCRKMAGFSVTWKIETNVIELSGKQRD